MRKPIAIVGFGEHGRVVAEVLMQAGYEIVAATTLDPQSVDTRPLRIPLIDDATLRDRYTPHQIDLALGIGSIQPVDEASPRCKVVHAFRESGFRFVTLRHPFSCVATDVRLGEGAQLHAGVIVQPGATVGDYSIVNTKASIDHDCHIGSHTHIGPGATLSGCVRVGDGTHLGTGCCVIQGISIGARAFIAAGATVVKDVPDGAAVRGTPAKPFAPNW